MRFAIISDFHLGFGSGDRLKESFEAAKQALELAVQEKVDFILLAGDIFDSSIPKQETWHEAFKVFNITKKAVKSQVKISRQLKAASQFQSLVFSGIPVISIHGTHEFRGKDYKNALQVLEKARALIYLHAEKILVEKGSEQIAIQGLGGIPEKQALSAFQQWNPRPEKGKFNILIFHQSLKEFIPSEDEMSVTLSLSNLPSGFDLYVNGHLHWQMESKLHQGLFLMPGSTIFTQMKRLEAEKKKGFYLFDSEKRKAEFHPLPKQRKLFYHKMQFKGAESEQIISQVKKVIKEDLQEKTELTPLIRLRLLGTLKTGVSPADISFNEVLNQFQDQAIISLDKEFAMQSFKKRIAELRELQKTKASLAELGLSFLEKALEETDFQNAFEVKRVFDLLAENKAEEAMEILTRKKFKKEKPEIKKPEAKQARLT